MTTIVDLDRVHRVELGAKLLPAPQRADELMIQLAERRPAFRRTEDVSEETEVAIDREVKSILLQGQQRARGILTERREDLDILAELLLDKENLSGRDLAAHFERELDTEEPTLEQSSS